MPDTTIIDWTDNEKELAEVITQYSQVIECESKDQRVRELAELITVCARAIIRIETEKRK